MKKLLDMIDTHISYLERIIDTEKTKIKNLTSQAQEIQEEVEEREKEVVEFKKARGRING